MKKLSAILAATVLFAGVSFASPVVKQEAKKAKTEKKTPAKKAEKTSKKASAPAKASK